MGCRFFYAKNEISGFLTHTQPHKYAVVVKVFGLAFFKKQVGLGKAQGFDDSLKEVSVET
ncbi:MAG: hypothetical protein AB7E42_01580 [Anaerotignaceae bacterium]